MEVCKGPHSRCSQIFWGCRGRCYPGSLVWSSKTLPAWAGCLLLQGCPGMVNVCSFFEVTPPAWEGHEAQQALLQEVRSEVAIPVKHCMGAHALSMTKWDRTSVVPVVSCGLETTWFLFQARSGDPFAAVRAVVVAEAPPFPHATDRGAEISVVLNRLGFTQHH